MRFAPPAFNFAFIAGDNRSVVDYSIDEQLGLKALDGEHVYIACASSLYLDQKVNSERTAFTLDQTEIDEIKRVIAAAAREYLNKYIQEAISLKVVKTRELIGENPQFLYLTDELQSFAEGLQPNASGKEEIFLEIVADALPSAEKIRRHRAIHQGGRSTQRAIGREGRGIHRLHR